MLVKLFGGVEVAEYSSGLSSQRRRAILRDFRNGKIQLLVCSDAMARGMDIENVKYVISYDAPNFVKTYIHRVGRTARAGNTGEYFPLCNNVNTFLKYLLYCQLQRKRSPVFPSNKLMFISRRLRCWCEN